MAEGGQIDGVGCLPSRGRDCISRSVLRVLVVVLSVTSAQAQSGPRDVPCEGTGRLVSTPVTVEAMGRSMVLGHGTDDAVEVSVTDCGRRVVIDAPQARIELLRSVLDDHAFEGTVVTDMPAEWTLGLLNPKLLEGEAVNTTPQGTATAGVTLSLTNARAPDLEGCFEDVDEAAPPGDTAHEALSDVLLAGERSLPSGYEIGDYVSSTRAGALGRSVHVYLSATDEIVPLQADSISLEAICAGEGWLEPPRWMLNYKFTHATDATYVFVQKIEIETGIIQAQREGVVDGLGSDALRAAMREATANLSDPPRGFSAGAS